MYYKDNILVTGWQIIEGVVSLRQHRCFTDWLGERTAIAGATTTVTERWSVGGHRQ